MGKLLKCHLKGKASKKLGIGQNIDYSEKRKRPKGFICPCTGVKYHNIQTCLLVYAADSGERLQDHWSSGFLVFDPKHTLWVLVRTASGRRLDRGFSSLLHDALPLGFWCGDFFLIALSWSLPTFTFPSDHSCWIGRQQIRIHFPSQLICVFFFFSSPVRKYRKSYCSPLGVGISIGISFGVAQNVKVLG